MGKLFPLWALAVLFATLCELVLKLAVAHLVKGLLDATSSSDVPLLRQTLWQFGGLLAFAATLLPLSNYWVARIGHDISGHIRKTVHEHIQKLPLRSFRGSHGGEFISWLTNDVAEAEKAYLSLMGNLAKGAVVAVGAIVYMTVLEWRMAGFVVITALLSAWVTMRYTSQVHRISATVQERLAALTTVLRDLLTGLAEIKAYNLEKRVLNKYTAAVREVLTPALARVDRQASFSAASTFMSYGTLVGTLGVASWLAIGGQVSIGVTVACVELRNPVVQLFTSGGYTLMSLGASLAAVDRLASVLNVPQEDHELTRPLAGVADKDQYAPADQIIMEDVHFQYDCEGPAVLAGLSLTVRNGEVAALVGPSGAGKTTVFRLLMGFYEPQRGSIMVFGRPLVSWSLEELRSMIALVPQEASLFPGTVAENIAFGKPGATMPEIVAAAKTANAHHIIAGWECGYETLVGEGGSQISGGQGQLIAMARAVIKDAPILLMDEPTSALDTVTEALVKDALQRVTANRTTLVIAHRLSTIEEADRILVVEAGRVVEEGKHAELLSRAGGRYRKLHADSFWGLGGRSVVSCETVLPR
ncbi:MAG: ABC transporter ATP-binding protein [Bacillota bacterium]